MYRGKIEIEDDPLNIECEIEYTIKKTYQPDEFGEREFIEIDTWNLVHVERIWLQLFGEEIDVEPTDVSDGEIEKIVKDNFCYFESEILSKH